MDAGNEKAPANAEARMGADGRCIPGLVVWIAGSRTPDSHRVADQGAHGFDQRHYRLSPAAWACNPQKRKSPTLWPGFDWSNLITRKIDMMGLIYDHSAIMVKRHQ